MWLSDFAAGWCFPTARSDFATLPYYRDNTLTILPFFSGHSACIFTFLFINLALLIAILFKMSAIVTALMIDSSTIVFFHSFLSLFPFLYSLPLSLLY
ncbi:hypothetical protein FN846DRAFT_930786 [Sphaerosporella brunnea]|uniref:Uncharacterized protein n=1 Tax=Sphaerosporella brunnea TaxID=1250544 RepID=A0A5J5F7S8_9PEZI|nr:hypothetical protein FN846DRAFT_930786 [Sphaerosporella brunnea]